MNLTDEEKYKGIGLGVLAVIIGITLFCFFGNGCSHQSNDECNDVQTTVRQLEESNQQAGNSVDDAADKLGLVEESIDSGQKDAGRLTESADARTAKLDECQEQLDGCKATIKAERDLYREIDKANGIPETQTNN